MSNPTTENNNGSKLGGKSSNRLLFTTEGENGENSIIIQSKPKVSVSDEKSNNFLKNKILTYEYSINNEYLNNIIWNWSPNHNTPGYITGNLKCEIDGIGSYNNMLSNTGGIVYLNFSGLNYTPPVNEKSQRYTDEIITLEYPANDSLMEDGYTLIGENFYDLGQIAYNTPSPIAYYNITTEDNNKIYSITPEDNKTSTFIYNNGQYDNIQLKVLSNLPTDMVLGTVSGKPILHYINDTATSQSDGTIDYNAQQFPLKCTNDYSAFIITDPDYSQASTSNRELKVNFNFTKEMNNVGYTLNNDNTTVTVYQLGGYISSPTPSITYFWSIDSKYKEVVDSYFNSITYSSDHSTAYYNWKENPNSKGYSKGNITWGTAPINPINNEGDEQYLTLTGLTMVQPINAIPRKFNSVCVISAENAQKSPLSKLKGVTIFDSVTGDPVGIVTDYTMTQLGTSWDSPDMYVKLTVTPYSTNPANVTNDNTRIPSCTINGSTSSIIRIYTDENGTMLHDEIKMELSNNMPISTTDINTGTIPISGGQNAPDNTASTFTKILIYSQPSEYKVNWALNSIPAMPECKYDISAEIIEYGNTTKNQIDSSLVTNKIEKITITDNGNKEISKTYKSEIVKVTNSNSEYFKVSPSSVEIKAEDVMSLVNPYLKEISVSTTTSNACSLNSVIADNVQDNGNDITCDLKWNGINTTNKTTTITLSTNNTYVGLSKNTFNYTQKGQSCSGTIKFIFTNKSTSINLADITGATAVPITESIPIISENIIRDRGSWYKGTLNISEKVNGIITVENNAGSKKIKLIGDISIIKQPIDVKFNVKGILNDDIIGNDNLKGTTILDTDFILSAGDEYTIDELVYEWSFTPAEGITGVSIDNINESVVTINYPENPNELIQETDPIFTSYITTGSTFPDIVSSGSKLCHCVDGVTSSKSGRTLGTLTCKLSGVLIDTVTIYQNGIEGKSIEAKSVIKVNTNNADCTLNNYTISNNETAIIESLLPNYYINKTFIGLNDSYTINILNNDVYEGGFDTPQTASLELLSVDNNGINTNGIVKCNYSCKSYVTINITNYIDNTIVHSTKTITLTYIGYDDTHKGLYKFSYNTEVTKTWSSENTSYWDPDPNDIRSEYVPDINIPQDFSVTLTGKLNDITYAIGTSKVYVDSKHYYNV